MARKGATAEMAQIMAKQQLNVNTITGEVRPIGYSTFDNTVIIKDKKEKVGDISVWDEMVLADQKKYTREQKWLADEKRRQMKAL